MNRRHFLARSAATYALVAIPAAAVSLSSCTPALGGALNWEEDVVLGSGETIRIARRVKFSRSSGLGSHSGGAAQFDQALLRSIDPSPLFPDWDAPLFAIYLDRDSANVWWLIAGTDDASMWARNGEPPTGQWAFRTTTDGWKLAPVPARYYGRTANLLVDYQVNDTSTVLRREGDARKESLNPIRVPAFLRGVSAERPRGLKPGSQQPPLFTELRPFME